MQDPFNVDVVDGHSDVLVFSFVHESVVIPELTSADFILSHTLDFSLAMTDCRYCETLFYRAVSV